MARDQIRNFERWRRKLPPNTGHFVSLVIDEIVPIFRERGFERFPDYAGASTYAVGPNCIPLQRRSGAEWPTVEILFDKRFRPTLGVHFAMLPEICWRQGEHGPEEIPRLNANVVEGRAFFTLCKAHRRSFHGNFGIIWFAFRPKRVIAAEIANLKALLPWLLDVLDNGIPEAWYDPEARYVHQHAIRSRPLRRFRSG